MASIQRPADMPRVMVIDSSQAFADLQSEWEELYHASPLATPFQSWAWLYSWWEFYAEGRELRLITVRDRERRLVGVIPLMLERTLGVGMLFFVGNGLTDYLDMIAREGWEDQVSEAGVQALRQLGGWHVADLQHLRPQAAVWGIFRRWRGPRIRLWQGGCSIIELKSWETLLASLSRNHRSTTRRAVRRVESDGILNALVSVDDVVPAARRLVTLSQEQWQGNPLANPEHFSQRYGALLVTAADRMAAHGLAGISEFWQDGQVLISSFMVFGRNFVGTYVLGASEKARRHYQWSALYIWDAVHVGHSRNSEYLDLLVGLEPYKLRWKPRVVPLHRVIVGANPILWSLYAGYHALRSRVVAYVRSETAPQWALKMADQYRTLRNNLAYYMR